MSFFKDLFSGKKDNSRVQSSLEHIRIDRKNVKLENDFTKLIDRAFSSENWQTTKPEFEFKVRNPFGTIDDLELYISVLRNGSVVYQTSKKPGTIPVNTNIEMTVDIGKEFSLSEMFVGVKNEYEVRCDRIEFQIPEINPLYLDADVRDAVGMKRIKTKETPVEEYLRLAEGLRPELKEVAVSIKGNIDKARTIAEGDAEAIDKIDTFVARYIPLMNSVMENHLQQDEAKRDEEELSQTLNLLERGSKNLIEAVQFNDNLEAEVAKDVIETQLIRDGLLDPIKDK